MQQPRMQQPRSKWMPLFSAAVVVTMLAAQPVQGELLENATNVSGTATRKEAI
jgi:hypothetical protein